MDKCCDSNEGTPMGPQYVSITISHLDSFSTSPFSQSQAMRAVASQHNTRLRSQVLSRNMTGRFVVRPTTQPE